MNTEPYVTYLQAMQLRELGFDWPCDHHYTRLETLCDNYPLENFNEPNVMFCSAPSLSMVQRWIREVIGIAINVIAHDGDTYHYELIYLSNFHGKGYQRYEYRPNPLVESYDTALSNAITEVTTLLLETDKPTEENK